MTKSPTRKRVGRSAGKDRRTASGFVWSPTVPGTELSPRSEERMRREFRAIEQALRWRSGEERW